ncbi:hypothetical protein LTR62_001517 [Meristemomyces frigidus]|uniref:Transcription initiation factor TFIID subunit 8 n=1 Tax=Meristemomyces frigidus TaxID=1508187 RepID=A0AAN7TLL5_9PEZI|nr:hypothetical protein LTR62_001517 [Meristemomyces frigidus]
MAEKRRWSSALGGEQSQGKRRRVIHSLRHVQQRPEHIEPAPQEPAFTEDQLLKSIGAALTMVGFDGIEPGALEMLRSHTEEYMLRFTTYIRTSMHNGRRITPIAQDFSQALSFMPNTSTASNLKAQIKLPIPETISYPSIPAPAPAEPTAPDFSALLQPLTTQHPPRWIPSHFPALPARHSWQSTPVFPEREKDARKMRELATQEGQLAEQALRRLATAAKAGAIKAEQRRSTALSGMGKVRDGVSGRQGKEKKDVFADVMLDLGGVDVAVSMEGQGVGVQDGVDVGMPEGVVVNYDLGHWRGSGQRKGLRL